MWVLINWLLCILYFIWQQSIHPKPSWNGINGQLLILKLYVSHKFLFWYQVQLHVSLSMKQFVGNKILVLPFSWLCHNTEGDWVPRVENSQWVKEILTANLVLKQGKPWFYFRFISYIPVLQRCQHPTDMTTAHLPVSIAPKILYLHVQTRISNVLVYIIEK